MQFRRINGVSLYNIGTRGVADMNSNRAKQEYGAVIFDLDGTLINSAEGPAGR
jgi:hypothetical protein